MKPTHRNPILAMLLIITLVVSACAAPAAPAPSTDVGAADEPVATGEGRMTEVGTPRHETLIVDSLGGRINNPMQMNPYMAGTYFSTGVHQLAYSNLWDMNTMTGEQFPALAAEMPEPLNDDYTKFRIKLREGVYWSDGVELTTEDMAFTIDMVLGTPEFPYSGALSQIIKSYEIVDSHTIDINTVKSEPRISFRLGVVVWGNAFRIIPKHIFENEDVKTFNNYPPVTSGPYVLTDVDPNGNWFLWEKRADWDRTDVGMIAGEPTPQYILYRFYGPEERRVIAGIQNDLDIFTDITPESWEILRASSEYARTWYPDFPYANLDDPCERGIAFQTQVAPFDNPDVRWALTLATDATSVSLATFAGMLRTSPLPIPPVAPLQETYHRPMRQWLTDFAFEDGYQPFDPDFAARMADILRSQGVEGIPTDEAEIIDLFGVGWWKHDPAKATELLEGAGLSKDADGKWLLPDGTPWQFSINAPANFEVQSQRLAFAVADAWRNFGIDVNVQQMESGTFASSQSLGNFTAGSFWPGCGVAPDVYENMRTVYHNSLIVPAGTAAPGNIIRYDSPALTAILDELAPIPSSDPRTIELHTEFMKQWVVEMPWMPMFGTSKFVPFVSYYWENLPSSDNPYEGPWWWWSLFKYQLPNYKQTGRM